MKARASARGFTLVEVMVVVAIISVLATLAVYGVSRYIHSAKSHEATNMIKDIKEGQELYRRETSRYLPVSASLNAFYPTRSSWNSKVQWGAADASLANWNMLNVKPDGPTYFSYACITGTGDPPADAMSPQSSRSIDWGDTPTGEWYVVKAVADLNGDGKFSVFIGSSLTNEIWSENEGE